MSKHSFPDLRGFPGRCSAALGLAILAAALPGATEWTLADALAQGLANNPQLKAFEARYEGARARIPQARALPDPRLQATHFIESVETRTGPQRDLVALSQALPWFGTRRQREAAASAEADAVEAAWEMARLDLVGEVAQAWFEYGYTARAKSILDTHRELLEDLTPVVEEKVRTGAPLNTLLRLQLELGRVEDRRDSLASAQTTQRVTLARLLARPPDAPLPAPAWERPPMLEPVAGILWEAVEARHPGLRMLQLQSESAAARRELARLGKRPEFTLGLQYIRLGNAVNPLTPDSGNDPWGFTVAINLPLWRGRLRAAEDEARALERAAGFALTDRRNQLQAELTHRLVALEDAQRRLVLYGDTLVELARQGTENSRASYESGQTSLLSVIDSERSLLDLELLSWRAAADAWKARVQLQVLTQQPFLDPLAPTPPL